MVVYKKDGQVIARSEADLVNWIANTNLEVVAGWGMRFKLPFMTADRSLMDALDLLTPEERRRELTAWLVKMRSDEPGTLDDIMEMLDIVPVEVVPMEEREYRMEPYFEPWQVKGREIDDYYDEAEAMEVGDVYQNSAYRITRSKNAKGRKGRGRRL